MTRLVRVGRDTFAALAARNYRLFFAGQIISVSGSWMQQLAQAWLVLSLTGSGVALGLVVAAQFLPMLILGPMGGVVADRVHRRRFLIATQTGAALLAAILAVLVATGAVQVWMVFALALALGTLGAFDMPVRHAFVYEMVGPDLLTNAVSLNSTIMNLGKLVGPALGGVVIAVVGLAACFAINAASFVLVIAALVLMRPAELHTTQVVPRAKGQLREGFRYVWATPGLRVPLLMMAVIGTLAYEFQVTLPLLARFAFGAGPEQLGLLLSAMAAGAVAGGLLVASRARPSHRRFGVAGAVFGALTLLTAFAPTFGAAMVIMPFVGAASILFIALGNSVLQLTSDATMRGRVIALYGVAFLGSTPIGGPIAGWMAEALGPRVPLVVGGVATLAVCALGWRTLRAQADLPALTQDEGASGSLALRPAT